MEFIETALDWAWAAVLLVVGGIGTSWRKVVGRIDKLETETMSRREIETLFANQSVSLARQHGELKVQISALNEANSASLASIYKKIDASRQETKADFRAELNTALGRRE